jgi:hypothetical protein
MLPEASNRKRLGRIHCVMPGLDPGIQGCRTETVPLPLDRRVKPGDDNGEMTDIFGVMIVDRQNRCIAPQ